MDRDLLIDIESQSHFSVANLEHRDFEHALEAAGASNHDGFLAFPGQDQHGRTSVKKSNQS
jgi:hypothetical protein